MARRAATRITARCSRDAVIDLTHISPRRVWALAWLADQGVDPPPRGGRVRRVHPDPAVCRLVPRSRQHRSRPAVSRLRAHGHELPGAAVGAVSQRAEPAGRHQEPHAAHRGHQAGAGQRDRAGADRGLRRRGNLAAGGHGRDQLRVRRARTGPHPPTHGRRSATGRRAVAGQPAALARPHQPRPSAPPQGDHRCHRATAAWRWSKATARADRPERRRQGDATGSARPKGCSWPACPSTASSPSATARASPRKRASTSATSGRTAATSRAARWPRPCGPSTGSPKRRFPTACPWK